MNTSLEFSYSTPALLFPAVSLLFLAFTNRFITYADLIRSLHRRWSEEHSVVVKGQIANLRLRMAFILWMQVAGAMSLLFATVCMVLLFFGLTLLSEIVFGAALAWMLLSLALLVIEISISMKALNLQLKDMEGV
ncbi:MAG: DUF2721 domain-containing protein [Spirochaetales bacterium]|nr:DUF2721 domain-containing protein [Spirochaetales bacterium]